LNTTSQLLVGQPVQRIEDEALLRGQGRFMDDIDPVPHARHAAIVRSPFASRPTSCATRSSSSMRTALPGNAR